MMLSMFQARPQRADAVVNMTSAKMKVCFVPKRSPAHPLTGMNAASASR